MTDSFVSPNWKPFPNANEATFNILKKEPYCISVTIDHTTANKRVVAGVCMTTDCDKTYQKNFKNVAQGGGPFCDTCLHVVKKKLLKDEYPDIFSKIIRIFDGKDPEIITSGSGVDAVFRCDKKCSQCKHMHEWTSKVINVVNGCGCPICAGHKLCPCQQTDQFKCSACQIIKNNEHRIGTTNVCKKCMRIRNDNNLELTLQRRLSSIEDRCKKQPHKKGDVDYSFLLEQYYRQEGKCFISGITMSLGSHMNWQISVERIDNNIGYTKDNVVLICLEFQSGYRQWTREIWDEVCALSKGVKDAYPEELEFLKDKIEQAKKPNCLFSRMILKKQNTTDTTKQCNECERWFPNDQFVSTQTFCKECRNERQKLYENTLRGRLKKCLTGSKHSSIRRGMKHSLTYDELLEVYERQGGRCAYSRIPLILSGMFQMSIDRIDVNKGYEIGNVHLIILGLNVGDWSGVKNEEDEKDGCSGWNREKFLYAVSNNHRKLEMKPSSIHNSFRDCPVKVDNSVDMKLQMIFDYYQLHKKFPPPNEQKNDIQIGRFWLNVKHSKIQISDENRKKFLNICPNCFQIRPISESAKNQSMEDKIDLLIKFYEINDRWPTNADRIDGFNIGNFRYNLKKHPERAVKTNRMNNIMSLDSKFFL